MLAAAGTDWAQKKITLWVVRTGIGRTNGSPKRPPHTRTTGPFRSRLYGQVERHSLEISKHYGVLRSRSCLVGGTSTDPGVARRWHTLQRGSIAVPAHRSCCLTAAVNYKVTAELQTICSEPSSIHRSRLTTSA